MLSPKGRPPIKGAGFSMSLAIVLRVTGGILVPEASSAPEPTLMTTVGPLPMPAKPVRVNAGKPVILPGWTLETPPEPSIKKGVLIGAPFTLGAELTPAPLEIVLGEGNGPGNGIRR